MSPVNLRWEEAVARRVGPAAFRHLLGRGYAAASTVVFPTNLGSEVPSLVVRGRLRAVRRSIGGNAATLVFGPVRRRTNLRVGASRRRRSRALWRCGLKSLASAVWRLASPACVRVWSEARSVVCVCGVFRTVRCVGCANRMLVRGGSGRRGRPRRCRSAGGAGVGGGGSGSGCGAGGRVVDARVAGCGVWCGVVRVGARGAAAGGWSATAAAGCAGNWAAANP